MIEEEENFQCFIEEKDGVFIPVMEILLSSDESDQDIWVRAIGPNQPSHKAALQFIQEAAP